MLEHPTIKSGILNFLNYQTKHLLYSRNEKCEFAKVCCTSSFNLGILNYCNCSRPICNKCKQKWNGFTDKRKKWFDDEFETFLIHGLAAFIVVCYTRVTLLSMNFLISTPLHHDHKHIFENRAYLAGTIKH